MARTTANVGRVSVSLEANTAQYTRNLRNAQATTRTQTRSMGDDLKKFAKVASGALAALGIGAAAVELASLAQETAAAGGELENFATIAQSSSEDLAAFAFASDSVGVSLEQVSDISKDVLEKLSEFSKTGSGGFKEFFEQVGEQVNLTAEDLENLSGPQVLGKMVSAMEEANLSTSDMSFYLEAVGSDATKLIPILRNGGLVANEMSSEFKALNTVLSTGTIKSYKDVADAQGTLTNNFANFITESLRPANEYWGDISESAAAYFKVLADQSKAENVVDTILGDLDGLESAIASGNTDVLKPFVADIASSRTSIQKEMEAISQSIVDAANDDSFFGGFLNTTLETEAVAKAEEQLAELSDQLLTLAQAEYKINLAIESSDAAATAPSTVNISDDEALAGLGDLEADIIKQNEEKLRLEKDFQAKMRELKLLGATTEQELLDAQYEQDLVNLQTQYGNDLRLTEQLFAAKNVLAEQYVSDSAALKGAEEETNAESLDQQLSDTLGFGKELAAINSVLAAVQVWGSDASFETKVVQSAAATASVVGLAGQFHSGSDYVPSEDSFLLQKGERVIQPEANRDLTKFLSKGDTGSTGGGGTTTVNQTVNGGAMMSAGDFEQLLLRSADSVAGIVSKKSRQYSQRR